MTCQGSLHAHATHRGAACRPNTGVAQLSVQDSRIVCVHADRAVACHRRGPCCLGRRTYLRVQQCGLTAPVASRAGLQAALVQPAQAALAAPLVCGLVWRIPRTLNRLPSSLPLPQPMCVSVAAARPVRDAACWRRRLAPDPSQAGLPTCTWPSHCQQCRPGMHSVWLACHQCSDGLSWTPARYPQP